MWVPFSMHHIFAQFSNQIWSRVSDNTPYTVSWCQRVKLELNTVLYANGISKPFLHVSTAGITDSWRQTVSKKECGTHLNGP